jgi:signal transduction histidine kinase
VEFKNLVDPGFEIHADPDMMFRALQNLTRNACQAIEAREDGNIGGVITVKACHEGANEHVEVADTGPGLPTAAREQLFKPFLGSAHSGGTGLGLANVQEILLAHGGDVELVKSGADGTVFRLTLPR